MNLLDASKRLRKLGFSISRAAARIGPAREIAAFGEGKGRIGSILVVNLDRQPMRWRGVVEELGRFRTFNGLPLLSIAKRFSAVDARDGSAVAATADVDTHYRLGDQLFVQPNARLEQCFGKDEPVRMTRQEVAVARSHIEVWKTIARGCHSHVLVLEDDIWFRRGAAEAIDRGWQAALRRCSTGCGPHLLYFSYADAGGTAERADTCEALFRPLRGLWYLSGYVLSRDGAEALLRAMPVVGPVDLWINYRFEALGALALVQPAILQRQDVASDNCYSVLPFLARAGIVDAGSGPMAPSKVDAGPILAWDACGYRESLAMALSMLGLRVRAFDGNEEAMEFGTVAELFKTFDALVNVPLTPDAVTASIETLGIRFIVETHANLPRNRQLAEFPKSRTAILPDSGSWRALCSLIKLPEPVHCFPVGAPRDLRLFRDDRLHGRQGDGLHPTSTSSLDDSPWVLPQEQWRPRLVSGRAVSTVGEPLIQASMNAPTPAFPQKIETFPGNLASFEEDGLTCDGRGTHLRIHKSVNGDRPYRSGAFASASLYGHGRFEAEIRAARAPGVVTGFFLHRDAPRQELDIELLGHDCTGMLVNVFFNPGDEGAAYGFGYRGSPHRIDLGFDPSEDFHLYAIDWRPERIAWLVDGKLVHERVGWDPTPIPHLPMRLHGNLWAPRAESLAGKIRDDALPVKATFKNLCIRA